jgi:long-chain acyl-CoA synthetase
MENPKVKYKVLVIHHNWEEIRNMGKKSPYESRIWQKNYDEGVPPKLPEPKTPLSTVVDDVAKEYPDKTAVVFYKRKITFRELKEYTDRLATAFVAIGVKKGDIIGLHMPNLPHYPITMWGAWKAGAVVMGVSPLMKEWDLKHQLKDSGAKVVVSAEMYVKMVNTIKQETKLEHVISAGLGDFPEGSFPRPKEIPGATHFVRLMTEYKPNPPNIQVDIKEAPAFLQYTGGTTGLPKGAIITHYNHLSNMYQFTAWLKFKRGVESVVSGFPYFHIAGTLTCTMSILNAAQQALVVNPRDLPLIFQLVNEHKPTLLANVSTLYMLMLRHPDFRKCDFSSVKYFISAAAPFPAEVIREFEKATGRRVIEAYGLTECSPLVSSNPVEHPRKIGSVGMPFPDTDIKIVEIGTKDKEVAMEEPGDLLVRGPQVFKGYWNRPEETKASLLGGGWVRTGDVAKMDEDGYIYIVDRTKDMINVGGLKVYPREVDDLLCEHPAVMMAATVGLPDAERPGSERIKAYVVLKQGYEQSEKLKQEIAQFVKDKVAPYKVPRFIEFRKELPLTLIGKVVKVSLREEEKSKSPK